jgi:transposase
MWVTVGYYEEKKVILFHYHPSRSGEVARKLTDGYRGYIQTDGYAAYTAVGEREGIHHVGCWAHARRKFFDAKADIQIPGLAERALALIAKLFAVDNKCLESKKDLADSEFIERRRKQSKPVLDELKTLVDSNISKVPEGFNLWKAFVYVSGQWPKLIRYLEQSFLRPDNNAAENAIRPFVIGRKNWLFANTPLGAHASAAIYSLVETARANNLEPYVYLKFLFTMIPVTSYEQLPTLLPNRIDPLVLNETV